MRSRKHHKISARQVQEQTLRLLMPILGKEGASRCTNLVLLQVILTAAANMISVFGACLRLGTISDQTARKLLRKRLPKQRHTLEAKLNEALREPLPSRTRRRRRALAIDLHEIPYHGSSPRNHVLHKKPRSGTTKFFAYATACLVEKGHRYTLAFTWVKANETTVTILERLLADVARSGVKIRHLLLDRGFFSVAVMAFLKTRNVPFLMPVVFRGRKPARGKKHTGWRAFLRKPAGWYRHTHRHQGQEVTVDVCVAYKTYRHHRTKKRCNKKLVFAAWRVTGQPRAVCQMYRKRFGIEASYRQLGQARIRTSTRDPLLRLFFVALALLLRNLWVWLHWRCFGETPDPRPASDAKCLQFKWLLALLALALFVEDFEVVDPLLP
jgi:hypothetical protein